jgi:hypothetical protein
MQKDLYEFEPRFRAVWNWYWKSITKLIIGRYICWKGLRNHESKFGYKI